MKKIVLAIAMSLMTIFNSFSQTVVLEEGFEGATYLLTSSGSPVWTINDTLANTGTKSIRNQIDNGATSYLTSNPFNTTGNTFIMLEFAHICKINFFDTAMVQISVDGGTTWTNLTQNEYLGSGAFVGNRFSVSSYPTLWVSTNPTALPDNTWWRTETFDISVLASNKADVRIRFMLKDGNPAGHGGNFGWLIDDIKVTASPSELIPPLVVLNTPIVQDTVLTTGPFTISATITDASGIDTAFVVYAVNGGQNDTIGMINTSGNIYSAQIPSQSYNTHVDYKVFAIDNAPAQNKGESQAKWFYVKKGPDIVTIGHGTEINTTFGYPTPYGTYYKNHRVQYLLLASELNALGVSPGPITSIAFNVAALNNCSQMPNFTIKIKHTSEAQLTATFDNGTYQTVWTAPNFLPVLGWNTHTFTTPFMWNGSSNIIVDICYDLIPGSFTQNASVYSTTTTTNLASFYRSDSEVACGTTLTASPSLFRANMQIGTPPNSNDHDAGIVQIVNPTGTVITGVPTPVRVRVKNYGLQTLTSAQIGWSVNGVVQTPAFSWTGSLTQDQISLDVHLGDYIFANGPYEIKAWTYLPNGQTDQGALNDTAFVNVYGCAFVLNGTYTIGGAGADYATIDDALEAIDKCGISGPVVFEIAPGTYYQRMVFDSIPNTSTTNTITFRGTTGTIIAYAPTVSTEIAVIALMGAKHLRFDSLTIHIPDSATFGRGFYLGSNTQNIEITNCRIEMSTTSTLDDFSGIVASGSTTSSGVVGTNIKNILIDGNTIVGGYYGIIVYASSTSHAENISIVNNDILNTHYLAVRLYYVREPIVKHNLIDMKTDGNISSAGIYSTYASDRLDFSYNMIKNASIYGIYIDYTSALQIAPSIIANNAIGGGFRSTSTAAAGIYIANSAFIDIFYNSINCNAVSGRTFNVLSSTNGLNVKNNSFAYTGGAAGFAAYINSTMSFSGIDHNNYYSNGTNFVFYGAARADLASLQAVEEPVGNDNNSKQGNPNYSTPTMLFPTGTQLWQSATPISITDDIQGNVRDNTSPCIGAFEYTPAANDAALLAVITPAQSSCGFTSNENVSLRIKNFGTAPITSIDASYQIDGQAPVTETFTINVLTDSIAVITFTTPADLASYGIYNLNFWVNKTGDNNQLNDSILNYKVYSSHDFLAGPYTQSFEPTEFFADWEILNSDSSNGKWEIPFTNTTFANTGTNSARFNNITTNAGEDWLFSKCFNLEAGSTYEISFFYRNSSTTVANNIELKMGTDKTPVAMATSLVNLPGILNTAYTKATHVFVAPATDVYYFGWRAYSAPATSQAYIDDINIKIIPPIEASVIGMPTPNTGCGLGLDTVSIVIKNTGADTLNTTLTAYYQANGGTVVNETVTLNTFIPNQSITYVFATLLDMSTVDVDSIFDIVAWIDLVGDPLQFNDTIEKSVTSGYIPLDPIVADMDIFYGDTAIISPVSTDTLYWYNSPIATTHIFKGNPYITPVLYDTTTYYVEASTVQGGVVQIGFETSTQNNTPCNAWFNYSWSSSLFLTTELDFEGTIDTLTFFIENTVTNYVMTNQTIYMANVPYTTFSSSTYQSPTNLTQVFSGTVTWNGPGVVKVALTTPFYYDGSSTLLIHWEDNMGSYTTPYPFFYSSTVPSGVVKSAFADASFPTSAGDYRTLRPNIKFTVTPKGCTSNRVPVTVNVIPHPFDVGIAGITAPIDDCTNGTEIVEVLLYNSGANDITSGLSVSYVVNNGTPVTENVTTSIAVGDTLLFAFATPITINLTAGDSTINIKAYTTLITDGYNLNDTTNTAVTLAYTPPVPTAANINVPYATQGVFNASSPYFIYWYDDIYATTHIDTGFTFTTPPLYTDATYYVAASNTQGGAITQVGTGTLTQSFVPVYGLFENTWSSTLYLPTELNFTGIIDTIAFFVDNTVAAHFMANQRIYMQNVTYTTFPDNTYLGIANMTEVYNGNITWAGPGWFKIPLTTPFYYDGGTLLIHWENHYNNWASGYPTFRSSTVQNNMVKHQYQISGFPTSPGTFTTSRPNTIFVHEMPGCESERIPVTATVTGTPNEDAGIVSVDMPVTPTSTGIQNVEVTLHNYGLNALTAVDINWTVNNAPQTVFNWTGNLAHNTSISNVVIGTFDFTLGWHDIKVWTSLPNGVADVYNLNDTAEVSIHSYDPLNGIYTIGGTTPDFVSFAEAKYALYTYGVSGPVTFKVRSGTYNEKVSLKAYTGASSINTVTFMPDAGADVTLTTLDTFVVKIQNAAHYIFDGSNDGTNSRNFSIVNTSTNTNTAAIWLTSNNDSIIIRNCKISAGSNTVTSTFGLYLGGTTISTFGTGTNHNITIHNNEFTKSYFGVYVRAAAAPAQNNNLIITGNVIGSLNSADYVLYRGIDLAGAIEPLVEANEIFNMRLNTFVSVSGIEIGTNVLNAKISKNRIHGLRSLNTGSYGAYGINIASGTGTSGIEISNNFVSDILTSNSSVTSTLNAFGIRITGGTGHKVWYNSVNMHGTPNIGAVATMSAAFIITSNTASGADIRNNIFANNIIGPSGSKSYAIRIASGTTFNKIDYNDYFVSGSSGVLGHSGSADVLNLTAWRLVTLKDTNSLNVNPNFVAPNNLHTFSTTINDKGTPLAQVTDDIEGTIRDLNTPDIGAFEFDPLNWDMAVTEIVSPTSNCGLTNDEPMIIKLRNSGLNTVTTFDVAYSINGATPVSETFNGSLATDSVLTYTFATNADLSVNMAYNIQFYVTLSGDQYAMNDTLSMVLDPLHNFYTGAYTMGFEPGEDYSRWIVLDVNNDGTTWEPGHMSTTYSNTGSHCARYNQGSTAVGNDWMITECFLLEAGNAYKVEYWYRTESVNYPHNVSFMLGTDIVPSAFTDTLVNLVGFNNTTYQKASAIINISATGAYYFGWHGTSPAVNFWSYVDDINIRLLPPRDVGVTELLNVDNIMNSGEQLNLQARIKNFGSDTLTSIPVKYSIDGGTAVTETWMGTLYPDSSVVYNFATAFTIPSGYFDLCAWTDLSNDDNNLNDTTCANIFGIPLKSVPFADDFEGADNFYITGLSNQWERGIPAASVINTAHSPVNVWATNLTGNYNNSSNYNLLTPRFNFTSTVNTVLGFWHWYDTESGADGGRVQYTTNNGQTWQILGVVGDPLGTNWYNTSNVNGAGAFTGSSGGWVYSEFDLAQFNNYPVPVQFRFNFYSNSVNNNFNGWAIDDFEIYQAQIPVDAGVSAIVTPAAQVVTGSSQTVEVTIKNYGTDPLTTIPVRYRVNNGVPVNAQWTGTLQPGDSVNYVFATPLTQTASYTLCAYTSIAADTYKNNDTTCKFIEIIPAQYDAGVIEIITPDVSTVASDPVTVSIRIKNFGTEPLNSINVQYDINSGTPVNETYTGLLNPDEEAVYTFTQTYISPAGNYLLCARTTLSNDQNATNNNMCKTVTVGIEDIDPSVLYLAQNMPNPAQGNTIIAYNLPSSGKVVFEIVNLIGQSLMKLEGDKAAGIHYVEVDAENLPDGVYYYTLTFNGQQLTKKLVVTK